MLSTYLCHTLLKYKCFVVPNSPRLGSSTETYAQVIINSNDDAAGVLTLSPSSLNVTEETVVPQLRVVRSGGTFGEVSLTNYLKFYFS